MKKYFILSLLIILCSVGAGSMQAEAYSVTLQKDGIYADVLPESVVNNSTVLFEKYVNKAMQYNKKYNKADEYTLIKKVPEEYRVFIPIAKQIKDSDKIIIKNPFFIYEVDGSVLYKYYFVAEKNGEKLCLFSIDIDSDTGKVSFNYDSVMDKYSGFDENMLSEEAIFYKLNDVIYEQTKDKSSVILDQTDGSSEMSGGGDIEERTKNFKNMDYDGKKKEIFEYLEKIKSGKTVKKSEKNLKLELKDEYVEPAEEKKDSSSKGIYIVIGVVLIVGVVGVGMFLKKRKTR